MKNPDFQQDVPSSLDLLNRLQETGTRKPNHDNYLMPKGVHKGGDLTPNSP